MKFLKIILIVLVLFEMLVLIFYHNAKEDYRERYYKEKDELYNCRYLNEKYKEKLDHTLFTDNRRLQNVFLTGFNGDAISLDEIIDTTRLIYRFTYVSCGACVEKDIDILKRLGDSIGYQNIIIISKYEELIQAKAFLTQQRIESSCYNFKGKFNLSVENDSITQPPFFFLLDNDMKVKFSYISDGTHDFTSSYFRRIIQYYKTGM